MKSSKLLIETVKPESLIPYELNNKIHGDAEVDRIANSIAEFGFTQPILIDEQSIILAGHKRLAAAKKLGLQEVPVIQKAGLTEAQKKAYRIIDNKSSQESPWNQENIELELQTLAELGFDVAPFMLNDFTFETLPDPETGEDNFEPPAEAQTDIQRGDLFELGEHRLLCGDSTSTDDVKSLMGGGILADACLTDPPYGQNQAGVSNDEPEKLDGIVAGAVANLPLADGICVAFQSPRTFPVWLDAIRQGGHKFERMLWLDKVAQCAYPWRGWILRSESILVSTVGNPTWHDVHPYAHDVYRVPEVSGELPKDIGWHGSVKPLKVVVDILSRVTAARGIVFDPFLGSGTTLIAAEQLNRRCYGIEIEPKYCQVIVDRYRKHCADKGLQREIRRNGSPF